MRFEERLHIWGVERKIRQREQLVHRVLCGWRPVRLEQCTTLIYWEGRCVCPWEPYWAGPGVQIKDPQSSVKGEINEIF